MKYHEHSVLHPKMDGDITMGILSLSSVDMHRWVQAFLAYQLSSICSACIPVSCSLAVSVPPTVP